MTNISCVAACLISVLQELDEQCTNCIASLTIYVRHVTAETLHLTRENDLNVFLHYLSET